MGGKCKVGAVKVANVVSDSKAGARAAVKPYGKAIVASKVGKKKYLVMVRLDKNGAEACRLGVFD